jgi:hypothetical protein
MVDEAEPILERNGQMIDSLPILAHPIEWFKFGSLV